MKKLLHSGRYHSDSFLKQRQKKIIRKLVVVNNNEEMWYADKEDVNVGVAFCSDQNPTGAETVIVNQNSNNSIEIISKQKTSKNI